MKPLLVWDLHHNGNIVSVDEILMVRPRYRIGGNGETIKGSTITFKNGASLEVSTSVQDILLAIEKGEASAE